MAHRTNVTQVLSEIEREQKSRVVRDVVCGMEINRHESRHMVFRTDQTFYFCSEACRDKFLSGKKAA